MEDVAEPDNAALLRHIDTSVDLTTLDMELFHGACRKDVDRCGGRAPLLGSLAVAHMLRRG
eukprot:9794096-Alexandrium_andersonii.AAC.1